jgi:hypothetical protein
MVADYLDPLFQSKKKKTKKKEKLPPAALNIHRVFDPCDLVGKTPWGVAPAGGKTVTALDVEPNLDLYCSPHTSQKISFSVVAVAKIFSRHQDLNS